MKTEMKHTQEKWIRDGKFIYALIQDGWDKGKPQMVNKFWLSVDGHKNITAEEIEANAKLIAAAPELLEISMDLWKVLQQELPYMPPERKPVIKEFMGYAERTIRKAIE